MERISEEIISRRELIEKFFGGDVEKFRLFFAEGFIPPANILPKKGKKENEAGWYLESLRGLQKQIEFSHFKEGALEGFELVELCLDADGDLTSELEIQKAFRRLSARFPPYALLHTVEEMMEIHSKQDSRKGAKGAKKEK